MEAYEIALLSVSLCITIFFSFSMRSVSYQMKMGCYFVPELLVRNSFFYPEYPWAMSKSNIKQLNRA
jgi:hypothetical protein